MMAAVALYITAGVSVLGAFFAVGLWLDAREDVDILKRAGIGNGRLKTTRSRARQARYGAGYALIIVGKSAALLLLFEEGLRTGRTDVPPEGVLFLALIVAGAVLVCVDGWKARRETRAIERDLRARDDAQ